MSKRLPHLRLLHLACAVALLASPRAGSMATAQVSRGADTLETRDGLRVTGIVQDEALAFRTSYALLSLSPRLIVSYECPAPLGLAVVFGPGSNRFTGFLQEEFVSLRAGDGSTTRVHQAGISRLTFGARRAEPSVQPDLWLRLLNGDILSGRFETPAALLSASGELLPWDKVRRLSIKSGATNTVLFEDGSSIPCRWKDDMLNISLSVGGTLRLHTSAVAALARREAEILDAAAGQALPHVTVTGTVAEGTNFAGMAWVPPGEFLMGSPYNEKGRDPDEGPQTIVVIPSGFWIGVHEVTQGEFEKVMGVNPSTHTGNPRLPVEKVNWSEAMEYCARLTKLARDSGVLPEGWHFRLPTEAEWEYACRAGSTTRFHFGEDPSDSLLDEYAWFARNSEFNTRPVGGKKPNAHGLQDMHGNVWEWCLDRWERSLSGGKQTNNPAIPAAGLRAARGGSWLYDAKACRSANRDDYGPSNRCSDLGFRIVLAKMAE